MNGLRFHSTCIGLTIVLTIAACGGGGSGGSGGGSADLLAVKFLDPNDVNPEQENQAPQRAPLNQQILFQFSAPPPAGQVNGETIQIRDPVGFPVDGRYQVDGGTVVFTPKLPLKAASKAGSRVGNGENQTSRSHRLTRNSDLISDHGPIRGFFSRSAKAPAGFGREFSRRRRRRSFPAALW